MSEYEHQKDPYRDRELLLKNSQKIKKVKNGYRPPSISKEMLSGPIAEASLFIRNCILPCNRVCSKPARMDSFETVKPTHLQQHKIRSKST